MSKINFDVTGVVGHPYELTVEAEVRLKHNGKVDAGRCFGTVIRQCQWMQNSCRAKLQAEVLLKEASEELSFEPQMWPKSSEGTSTMIHCRLVEG